MSINLEISFIRSVDEIDKAAWTRLIDTDYPFIQHDFLSVLEKSGATSIQSGWDPKHLIIKNDTKLVAIMPLYIKYHSYGEYVFDFEWAKAYHRVGFQYYPKLVTAIPFTPCTGKRIYFDPSLNCDKLFSTITHAIKQFALEEGFSSWHFLFAGEDQAIELEKRETKLRIGCQYHWFNRSFIDFDDFLSHCKSKQRKNIKRERRLVSEQGIKVERLAGKDISNELWLDFFYFYQLTYAKRSGHGGYLSEAFFKLIGASLSESIVMVVARLGDRLIAAALFFKDSSNLYGRYWGCVEEFECLHFELCYYQGIEYCIKNKLKKFDAGAQGEHKIQRGFIPVVTYSNHWIADRTFSLAIADYLEREHKYVRQSIIELNKRSPFKTLS